MSEADILRDLRRYCTENFLYMRPDFVLGDDDKLLQTGVLDSMGVMEIVGFLEERFGVLPADHEINEANMGTLRSIATLVQRKRAA